MNADKQPSFRYFYRNDFILKDAVRIIFGTLIFQVVAYVGFNQFYPPVVAITAALTVIGIIMFVIRYNLIMKTLREGKTIHGKVINLETITTRSKNSISGKKSYYARIGYSVQGKAFEIRERLPDAPYLMGLKQGDEVELILREEKPKRAFIKMLYL